MRHTVLKAANGGSLAAVFGIAIVLALLLASPAAAQETEAEQTTAQAAETVTKEQSTEQGSNATVTQNESTVTTQGATSKDPQQEVQGSGQQAQADAGEDDDTQGATRAATTPTNQPARITESANDTDETVDRIVVPIADCEVEDNAVLVVEDDDGTRVRLTNGDNVSITPNDSALTIVGTGTGGNLGSVDASGGAPPQFGTVNEIVRGTVVSSTGIACGREDDGEQGNNGENGNDGGTQGDSSCANAEEVANVGPTTDNSVTPFETTGRTFRVSYDVTFIEEDAFSSVEIDVEDRFGLVDFEIVERSERDRFIVVRATKVQLLAVIFSLVIWMIGLTEIYWDQGAIPIVFPYLILMSTLIVSTLAQSIGILIGYRRGELRV